MPVLMVQKEIKKNAPSTLDVTVDNMTAVQNITRYASSQNYAVAVQENDGEFVLTLTK